MNQDPDVEKPHKLYQQHPKTTIVIIVIAATILADLLTGFFLIKRGNLRIPNPYYHHDLRANFNGLPEWGYYPDQKVATNSLGFRDREVKKISLSSTKKRILLLGDSFTEGLRIPWDDTFAGWLSRHVDTDKVEILNAAVSSYSPKLDYLKAKYLIENVGLKFDELYVFVDISDAQDEMLYKDFIPPGSKNYRELLFYELREWLREHSLIYNSLTKLYDRARGTSSYINYEGGVFHYLSRESLAILNDPNFLKNREGWTQDESLQQAWANGGLELGAENLQKLYELTRANHIRMTIVVYPWAKQILSNDLDSIQVRFWQKFSQERQIPFINLFPVFFGQGVDPTSIVKKYFVYGDVHWNSNGHELVGKTLLPYVN